MLCCRTFSIAETNNRHVQKSIFKRTERAALLLAVFPGVGETYRDVRDELPLAVSLSIRANVVVACKN